MAEVFLRSYKFTQDDSVMKSKIKSNRRWALKKKCKNRAYVNVDHVLSSSYISWQEIYDKRKKYISNEIGISEYHSIFLWYPYFTDISMKHPVFFIRYPYLALHPACLPGLHTLKPSSEPWRTTYRPRNRKFVNAFRTEAPAPGKCFCFPFGRLT